VSVTDINAGMITVLQCESMIDGKPCLSDVWSVILDNIQVGEIDSLIVTGYECAICGKMLEVLKDG